MDLPQPDSPTTPRVSPASVSYTHLGETIVLGGVFHDTITKGVDKVPLLGDIPGIKRLFSKESERHQKRELVIFVTPHILKQGERMEMAKKEKHFKQVEKAKK